MTFDQFKTYARHPIQYVRSLLAKRRGRKAAAAFMRKLLEQEAFLKASADPCCEKCMGRGHRGYNIQHKHWVVCSCTSNPRTAEKKVRVKK